MFVAQKDSVSRDRKGDAWSRFHSSANRKIDSFYYNLGFWVATHTKTTLLCSLLLVLVCCSCFVNFRTETDEKELWVPFDSDSKAHEETIDSNFNASSSTYATLLFVTTSQDGNILTKEAFDQVWEIDDEIRRIETKSGKSFQDLCKLSANGEECFQTTRSVTRFWSGNHSIYQDMVKDDMDLLDSVNVALFSDGSEVIPSIVFGNSITYSDGAIVGAEVMSQTYTIVSAREGAVLEEALDWQAKFQDLMAQRSGGFDNIFSVYYLTGRSLADALEASVSGDIFLFIITYCVMIAFVMVVTGRCCDPAALGRNFLALGGVTLVLAAGLAGYGVNSAFGVPFTALAQVLPFILIGIGVDDMFVILFAFDNTDPSLEVEQRVALALGRCGVSITYTSLTNFLAFMLGSITTLPAVRYFCLYAGTSILLDFMLQVTAFVALVTIHAEGQRIRTTKATFCCGAVGAIKKECTRGGTAETELEAEDRNMKIVGDGGRELGIFGRWMRDIHASIILSRPGKVLVLGATLGLLAAGIYGTTQVTQGFDVLDLAPDDHFARDYSNVAREHEMEIDSQFVPLRVYTRDVNYTAVDVQAQIQATDALMVEQEFVSGPTNSWLAAFLSWANTSEYSVQVGVSNGFPVYTDRDTFYDALTNFTALETSEHYADNLVYGTDDKIQMSYTTSYLINQTNAQNLIDALRDTRAVVRMSSLDPKPFAFTSIFMLTEQFLVIFYELITSFILALVAVTILSMVVLGRVVIVLLVSLTVVMIDIELLGFVHHWGLEVNSITVIVLIMAVGLVVDYVIHVVHYVLQQQCDYHKDKRIANGLGEIGPSITLGAMTTFLGILPMAFASSVIFRVFFRMFLIIIIFGFLHGILFVPVALSLLPTEVFKRHPEIDNDEATPNLKRGSRRTRVVPSRARTRSIAPKISTFASSPAPESPVSREERRNAQFSESEEQKGSYP